MVVFVELFDLLIFAFPNWGFSYRIQSPAMIVWISVKCSVLSLKISDIGRMRHADKFHIKRQK